MVYISQQNLTINNNRHNKKEASFGFVSADKIATGLDYLKQNPVLEVAALDVTTMVAPRTVIDYNQNPDYGKETLFRELAPVIFNPYGPTIVAALLMKYAMKYPGVHAGKDTLNTLHEIWKASNGNAYHAGGATAEQKHDVLRNYADNVLERIKTTTTEENKSFVDLKPEERRALADRVAKLIGEQNPNKKAHNKEMANIAEDFTKHTKASECLKVEHNEKTHFSSNIKNILEDVVVTGRKLFTQHPEEKLQGEVGKLMKFAPKKTLLGAGLSIASIITLPAINNELTKRRTGKSGYVAYKDDGKDNVEIPPNKAAIFRAKALGVAVIGAIMLFTMGAFGKKGFFKLGEKGFFKDGGGKNFMDKIELKGKDASKDLIKLIYGSSLISRILFSRDEQEAKNTTLRDSCGFLNWLVLGDFVTKLVGYFKDRKNGTFVNITKPIKDNSSNKIIAGLKTAYNWLNAVSLKSLNEIKAMNVSPEQMKHNVKWHTIANFAGLAWSMLTLGIAMPIINNTLTNRAREKQLKQREEYLKKHPQVPNTPNISPQKALPVKQEPFEYTGVKPNKDLKQFVRQFE